MQVDSVERECGLVKLYFVGMRLPSEDLVAVFKWSGRVQIRDYGEEDAKVREAASRVSRIRDYVYNKLRRRMVYIDEYRVWLAPSEDIVELARELSRYVWEKLGEINLVVEKLGGVEEIKRRYGVEATPVYLEPRHARRILEAAREKLLAEIEQLERRVEEAEKTRNRRLASTYRSLLSQRRALLEEAEKRLKEVEQHAETSTEKLVEEILG